MVTTQGSRHSGGGRGHLQIVHFLSSIGYRARGVAAGVMASTSTYSLPGGCGPIAPHRARGVAAGACLALRPS